MQIRVIWPSGVRKLAQYFQWQDLLIQQDIIIGFWVTRLNIEHKDATKLRK